MRQNYEANSFLPSATRTATSSGILPRNTGHRGIIIKVDVTAIGAPAGNISKIEIQIKVGDNFKTVYQWSGLTINAVDQYVFLLYPAAASAGQWTAAPLQGTLPINSKIVITHDDANSLTYSVAAEYLG